MCRRPAQVIALACLAVFGGACTTAAATVGGTAPAARETRSPTTVASVAAAPVPSNSLCLACHSHPGLMRTVAHVEVALDRIDPEAFAASAHRTTACARCHTGQASVPHGPTAQSAPSDGAATQLCSSCHKEASEGYAHTVHGTVNNLGDRRAPGCTDCHSAHIVKPVAQWTEADRGRACAQCHAGADAEFAKAATGHREASATWFAPTYFAGRFLVVLLACTLAFGTVHVELDMLRWGSSRIRRRRHHTEDQP